MEPMNFIIYALATWRIASLLVNENGPWEVFRNIRLWAGIQYDDFGRMNMIPNSFFAGVLSCVWCTSIWIGAFMTIFWLIFPSASFVFAFALSLSALAIGYNKLLE